MEKTKEKEHNHENVFKEEEEEEEEEGWKRTINSENAAADSKTLFSLVFD